MIILMKRKEEPPVNPVEILEKARLQFGLLCSYPVNSIVSFSNVEDGYLVTLEALERKAIPETMDVLGLYELHLDTDGNVLEFSRIKLRKRGDTDLEV